MGIQFHQLHCLNALRKFVFAKPTREESDWSKDLVHLSEWRCRKFSLDTDTLLRPLY